LQVTYRDVGGSSPPSAGWYDVSWPGVQTFETILPVPGAPDWFVYVTNYVIPSDSLQAGEGLYLFADDLVSEVVLDTVPEPSVTALLAVGGLALLRRRRKK
jgi:hypothetical protein